MAVLVGVAAASPIGDAPTTLCADIDWSEVKPPPTSRMLVPEDLVRLRDVGPASDAVPDEQAFSLSPDRRFVAFQIRQADAEANAYCIATVVLPLFGDRKPVIVNTGGELRRKPVGGNSLPQRMTGLPVADAPIWSPDGSWIAFLRQDGGRTRLWRAATDGSGSAPIAAVDFDVRGFRFANGTTIVLKLDGDQQEARADIEREAKVGFHYDDRFAPLSSSGPYTPVATPNRWVTLDIRSGHLRPANPHETELFLPARDASPQLTGEQANGDCSIGRDRSENGVPPITRLTLRCSGQAARTCDRPACSAGVGAAWLGRGNGIVRFVRR
jgi:hypothetical protein